jgi:predicted ATP-dependent endonuclease of OLD family
MLSVRTKRPRKKPAPPTGTIPMIDSLQIKNFRCFRELSVSDFGTVNVVVGDNGSGKTALLEAIFLCQAGNPGAAMSARTQRSLGSQFATPTTRDSYHALWRDLFYQFREDRTIEIAATGTPASKWTLKIFYDPKASGKS